MIQNDGDIIKGLGFVTLYAAYLEEQIDNLLNILDPVEKYDEPKKRWPISRKIKHARKLVKKINLHKFEKSGDLSKDLKTCIELFEDRNELIHGRIYGNFDRPDTLNSGRSNIPDREIYPDELYKLANEFDDFRSAIYRPMIFEIPKAINAFLNQV